MLDASPTELFALATGLATLALAYAVWFILWVRK